MSSIPQLLTDSEFFSPITKGTDFSKSYDFGACIINTLFLYYTHDDRIIYHATSTVKKILALMQCHRVTYDPKLGCKVNGLYHPWIDSNIYYVQDFWFYVSFFLIAEKRCNVQIWSMDNAVVPDYFKGRFWFYRFTRADFGDVNDPVRARSISDEEPRWDRFNLIYCFAMGGWSFYLVSRRVRILHTINEKQWCSVTGRVYQQSPVDFNHQYSLILHRPTIAKPNLNGNICLVHDLGCNFGELLTGLDTMRPVAKTFLNYTTNKRTKTTPAFFSNPDTLQQISFIASPLERTLPLFYSVAGGGNDKLGVQNSSFTVISFAEVYLPLRGALVGSPAIIDELTNHIKLNHCSHFDEFLTKQHEYVNFLHKEEPKAVSYIKKFNTSSPMVKCGNLLALIFSEAGKVPLKPVVSAPVSDNKRKDQHELDRDSNTRAAVDSPADKRPRSSAKYV